MRNKPVLTMPEQIVRQLRKDIYSGKYAEGEAITEIALSQEFGVSRGPVRHALLQLSKEGLLESIPNVGNKVAARPKEEVYKLILKARFDIEVFVAERVQPHLDSDDYEILDDILSSMREACRNADINSVYEKDYNFHEFFIQKYNDKHVGEIWHSLMSRIMMKYNRFENLMDSYEEHLMIIKAMKKGEIEEIRKLLLINIQ